MIKSDPFTPTILCLSHLPWDYVWQRPQHILSRIAQRYPVIYVNEPQLGSAIGRPHLKLVTNNGNISAWQPIFPNQREVLEQWRAVYINLVQELLLRQEWLQRSGSRLITRQPLIIWFYTPTPFYFLDHIPATMVVYDIMDELANFKNAAHDLVEREARLIERADLVFTGGRSLYAARRGRHKQLYMFLSGVEPEHFAQALHPATKIAAEIAHLPRPILGYYGVIDERLDLELLDTLARERPEWSIVMVGPVNKIKPESLPRLPNLHYLGQQSYAKLPNFLKGFDVCLMPFAINEATRYISPTKTLEYMAAHKPIVSTPVPDVVTNWSEVVYIGADAVKFIAAVRKALTETKAQYQERIACEEVFLAHNTWDYITQEMQVRIDKLLAQQLVIA